MTYSTGTAYDFGPFDRGNFSRQTFPHTVSGAVALILSILVGAGILYVHSATPDAPAAAPSVDEAPAVATVVTVASAYGALAAAPVAAPSVADQASAGTPAAIVASNAYVALLDPTYSVGAPVSLAQSSPLGSNFEPFPPAHPATIVENVLPVPMPPVVSQQLIQNVPLPAPRPPEPAHTSGRQLARQDRTTVLPSTPANQRSFFDKLFGTPQPSGPVLAYAAPEDGVANDERRSAPGPLPIDRSTAVYDISAHTVYLPDGTRLEAHSGLGGALDDPRYVSERMHGPTPPGVYDLQPREQLFHGVQALRLIPVGNNSAYGRAGLLAHTYMLGQNGNSFGCVSFRDYNAFLNAYLHGEVKRLTVVARLN